MTFTLVIYFLAGGIAVNATAGPWETLAECEAAATKTRRYSKAFVERVSVRCEMTSLDKSKARD